MTTTTETNSRWGKIPAWWLDHPDLDADGFAVLAALATFANENGVCWPSQSTLAAKLKRSRPTINRILQRLHDIGLVTIEHRRGRDGSRLSCLYQLRVAQNEEAVAPTVIIQAARPVSAGDRDDSPANAPCPAPSQEHHHPEQNPDSLASGGRGPVCEVPADWMPNTDDLAWARSRFGTVDLSRHVEGFVLRCQAHGYRYRDISAAWRAWLTQDAAAGKAPTVKAAGSVGGIVTGASQSVAEQRVNAWMTVAARLKGAQPVARPRF
ncbi:helix-turn-helix domain-containing protein [Azospirillum brasilense]|uniref:GntR family transcriptional regulator n=1 Tax=Azospirillum brasilense TaxID=192 RepID=A0A6L3B281_AZOBR|nr:helix-turn-helix domain-containing protein [Azospirillum brasilense]KAA0684858.1 GntR family transcriptional regulator [Azospirillum brasilense]